MARSPYHGLRLGLSIEMVYKDTPHGLPILTFFLLTQINQGSLHYAKAFGEASVESTNTDAVHWVASSTKLVTTVAVMQCVERGLLDLDADIASVLPEWENPRILTGFDENDNPIFRPATKTVTLRYICRALSPKMSGYTAQRR